VAIDGLPALMRVLDATGDPLAAAVHAVDPSPGGLPLTVVSRRAIDRLGGLDAVAGVVADDLASRARRAFGATLVDGVAVRPQAAAESVTIHDPAVDAAWAALGDRAVLPAGVVADFAARTERLTRHVEARLARELPADAREVAVWGVGPLTPIAVAALRGLGRHVVGLFARDGDGGTACAGLTIRAGGELDSSSGVWIVSACASPADAIDLLVRAPIARVVHLAEPVALRPPSPPITTSPAFEGLAHARTCRSNGDLAASEVAYRAILRDPGFEHAELARYELALVHEQTGRLRDAERGFRWLLRHWPEGRPIVAYNLGSLYERQERWLPATRAFEQALRLAPPDERARIGGCHFHLGEIARASGDAARSRHHYEEALAALPSHGKARARLAALACAYSDGLRVVDEGCRPLDG
jgi:tetratricopeptide (TPR) repeat protein